MKKQNRKSAPKSSKSKAKRPKPAKKPAARTAAKSSRKAAKPSRSASAAKGKAGKAARASKPAAKGKAAKPAPRGKAAKAAGKAGAKTAVRNGKAAPASPAAARKPARVRVRICKAEGCQNPQTTQGFCRLHYLAKWKEIREEKLKRAQKNLDRYVERMAGAKKPAADDEEGEGSGKGDEAVFEEDFGEFVDVLSREENLDKILNGIKVEDY